MLKKSALLGMVALTLLLLSSPSFCTEEYKIGVLSNRGRDHALSEWKTTAAYLSRELGKPFSIVPLGDTQLASWTEQGRLDFVYTNPAQYLELSKLCGIEAIATVVTSTVSGSADQFGSVIFVRRDSQINELADLKDKGLMCRGRLAFGGWRAAECLFNESGIDPDTYFKSLRYTNSHSNVVYAVQYGVVQAGVVRTGILEAMAHEGKIKMEEFRVIHPVDDGFPLVHSTLLYPEYPIAVSAKVPKKIRDQVQQVLFALKPTDTAGVAAKIVGYGSPIDYASVLACVITLDKTASSKP